MDPDDLIEGGEHGLGDAAPDIDLPSIYGDESPKTPDVGMARQDGVGQKIFNAGKKAFDTIKNKGAGGDGQGNDDGNKKGKDSSSQPGGKSGEGGGVQGAASKLADDAKKIKNIGQEAEEIGRVAAGDMSALAGAIIHAKQALSDLKDLFNENVKKFVKIYVTALIVGATFVAFVLGLLPISEIEPAGASECNPTGSTTTAVPTLNLGAPNSGGYYLIPESPNYDLNVNGGSPRDEQWGGKTLIEVISVVADAWNKKHPNERLGVGDLNAPNHDSHKDGTNADIYSIDSIFSSLPGHSRNPNYKHELAVELGKMFFDTKAMKAILYNHDDAAIAEVNQYISQKGLPGKMKPYNQHDDHFHLDVEDGATVAGITSGTTCGPSSLPGGDGKLASGTYAEIQAKILDYMNSRKILTDSNDPISDVRSGVVQENTLRLTLTMADYAITNGKKIRISVYKTGHRPGTWHEKGFAFDVANEEIAPLMMPWLNKNASNFKINELIFDNSTQGISSNMNEYNLKDGKPHDYSSSLLSSHRNHFHIATF
jgi:hypothetical protein